MFEEILSCQKCGLCCNQKPLLDNERECQIFWVGLSAKMTTSEEDIPLSPETNTGCIIKQIEDSLNEIKTYKTNLVKCVPLNENNKIRYPNSTEISCCISNLQTELNMLSPKIVFLLGEKVSASIEKYFDISFEKWDEFNYTFKEIDGTYYIPVQHPSYIYVYKRKLIDQYIAGIKSIISLLL